MITVWMGDCELVRGTLDSERLHRWLLLAGFSVEDADAALARVESGERELLRGFIDPHTESVWGEPRDGMLPLRLRLESP